MKKIVMILIASNVLTACGFEVVDTGYRGIKTRFGQVEDSPLPEGLYFYNPFTTSIREYSVRQEKWSDKTAVFTKDTQRVEVQFSVVYSADPNKVTSIYKNVGKLSMLEEKIIKPIVLGSLKDSIGQVIADELVSKRESVTRDAMREVKENLESQSVIITDLQFTDLDFDDKYEAAVEEKVVAIQLAQKAVNDTTTIKEKAKQTVLTAQAEAESMKIKSQALAQNKGLIEFEYAQRWDGKLPQYMMGNSVPFIDLSKSLR